MDVFDKNGMQRDMAWLRFGGRLAALVAFVTWVLLAAATTSWTSRLIDITLAYAMLGEITARRGRDV